MGWFQHIVALCELSLEYGFLPHTNAGPLSRDEMAALGSLNASMGLMLEQSTSALLDGVHRFAPSKVPHLRLEQLRLAGELRIPFTTGLLLGVGESEADCEQSLHDIAAIANEYNHIQEVILQPYSPAGDKHANASPGGYDIRCLPSVIRLARAILPADVAIQVPPNLVLGLARREGADMLRAQLLAGARDLGGISPQDEVNPTYPFPVSDVLRSMVEDGRQDPPQQHHRDQGKDYGLDQGQDSGRRFVLQRRLPVHDRLLPWAAERPKVRAVLSQMGYDV